MTSNEEQQFLNGLEKKLWNAADKLRSSLDAAVYKHAVLGLIFLKYVSDTFAERRVELEAQFRDPEHEYYLGGDEELIKEELEVRDFYTEKNVFWVPEIARWDTLQNNAKLPIGTHFMLRTAQGSQAMEMRTIGWLIDTALDHVEKENHKLKGVLNKTYTQLSIEADKLTGLIDLIGSIPFQHASLHAKDILGHVYEYFLGQFALAEGKKGGQYYTPKAIVTLIVEMLQPFRGRVYDPAMGSGGFFVQSERFIEEHEGKLGNISVYGQESNPTTWRLAAMNMAIRGIDFNFGGRWASTYSEDLHPDLRADFVMANPPFNMKEWKSGVKDDDQRWVYGTPPDGNANFAWLQHMLHHLAPNGSLGLLLANGSMSSNTNNEGEIRKGLMLGHAKGQADVVECMVALPGQLFTNTQIPACIWFLTKNKHVRETASGRKLRDRSKEVLFIDARDLGFMKDRVLRDFTREDIHKIVSTYHAWQTGMGYEDVLGFCKSATLDDIAKHDYVLTPGRYVGAAEVEEDDEPFAEKMQRFSAQLKSQFEDSAKLEDQIRKNLAGLGYDC
ncbi:class I SAM-dependent DNA methyltransferase [Pseudomonas synxantha]|uniref:class I SAM-dependent DNA methyltransferase n=2 Tax=Pseudomonas TaxID=286 RepID=UPI001C3349C9|nr:SAM-dependent DNA methyltransferase [Pseudomonas sp. NCIMB 10586]VCU65161.1 Putative type I restriction enzyme HindVIIP M protein [Pseudomonas synxantha]